MNEGVLDASALIDVLPGNALRQRKRERIAGTSLHAPSRIDAEVLSALGRLDRAVAIDDATVEQLLDALTNAPIKRRSLPGLITGAWARHRSLRLADALYVELSNQLTLPLVTTDRRLRSLPLVEAIEG